MKKIYIGIDLATKMTGFSVVAKNPEISSYLFHKTGEIMFADWPVDITGIKYYQQRVALLIKRIRDILTWNIFEYNPVPIEISMELSNFSNPKLTQRFAKVAGIIETQFLKENYANDIVAIKYFNANEWFKYFAKNLGISNYVDLSREERKKLSINEYAKRFNIKKSDNETDAFWIAYYSELCVSTEITENKNKEIKNVKKAIQLAKFSIKQYEKNLPKEKEAQKKFLMRIEKYKNRLQLLEKKMEELKNGN